MIDRPNGDLTWYKGQCATCGIWYTLFIYPSGTQSTPICPNCTNREVVLESVERIPAELAEEWEHERMSDETQEEHIKLVALQTRLGGYIQSLNE